MTHRDRIGIFGGTFDPIHIGHLVAAQNALHDCRLDRVIFMVAGDPWQKNERAITGPEVRLAAVEAAIEAKAGLEVSRMEIDRKGPTYTAETLAELHAQYPNADLFLILGTDAASKIATWRQPDTVARLSRLVVVCRPGTPKSELEARLAGWDPIWVEIPALDISSTDLRQRLMDGRPVDFLVPESALETVQAGWGYNK